MADPDLAPEPSQNAPHEKADVNAPFLMLLGVIFVIAAALLLVMLRDIQKTILPEATGRPISPPTRTPGEPPVNARIEAIPQPRLDYLEPLRAQPPTFRSSLPVSKESSPEFHAEDLRAARQPLLKTYGWVDREKGVARIPIDRAMDALLDSGRLGPSSPGARP